MNGIVEVQSPKFPTVRSLQGQTAKLPRDMGYSEMREVAYEDRLVSKYAMPEIYEVGEQPLYSYDNDVDGVEGIVRQEP